MAPRSCTKIRGRFTVVGYVVLLMNLYVLWTFERTAGPSAQETGAGAQVEAAQDFVTQACIADLFEIEAARLASERAENDQVKQFEFIIDCLRRSTSGGRLYRAILKSRAAPQRWPACGRA